MQRQQGTLSGHLVMDVLPHWLQEQLAVLHHELGGEVYLAGGAVRDLIMGKIPADIDLTVPAGAQLWAQKLAQRTGGAFVPLARVEDVARVVCREVVIDFSSFRQGAVTITDELRRRDLTINAMAVQIDPLLAVREEPEKIAVAVLDPANGEDDLRQRVIRVASPASLLDDPLRLVRIFRFAATLGFDVDTSTLTQVRQHKALLAAPSPERVAYELDLIMASTGAYAAFAAMAETGLLWEIIPALLAGMGLQQPESHHLDVLGHSLAALKQIERVVADPAAYFPDSQECMAAYLASGRHRLQVKWAALLHDLGKPVTFAINAGKGGRITFYNHDHAGASLFRSFAKRFRWSNEDTDQVAELIDQHMRPFFLANNGRDGTLTLRASIRMIKKAGKNMPGLFLLAMADSLAGQGEARIAGMEKELAALFRQLEQVRCEHVEPVQASPPLLTGRDLIEVLHLVPGPVFKEILAAVEEARMEGVVCGKEGALALAEYLFREKMETKSPEGK